MRLQAFHPYLRILEGLSVSLKFVFEEFVKTLLFHQAFLSFESLEVRLS
jgi:hypothetical protein